MIKFFFKIYLLFIFLISANVCLAEDYKEIPVFTQDDRILILAPHPDDETIAFAGVIQKSLKAGAKVKVMWLTNGDSNELSFIFYEKKIVYKKKDLLNMGEVRRDEALEASKILGLDKNDLIFLGYPDLGTLNIFKQYWGDTKLYKSILTRVKNVPYKETLSYNAPYKGESILKDFKTILLKYKPTKIFLTMSSDSHSDHKASYLFLQVALWDLEDKIRNLKIFPALVHTANWPTPKGFFPSYTLEPPKTFSNSDISWQILKLTEEEVNKKYEAVSAYKSQIKYNPKYLVSFCRRNELFGEYSVIKLDEHKNDIINWDSVHKEMNIPEYSIYERKNNNKHIESILYAKKNDVLHIQINLENQFLGVNLYLFGYSESVPFSEMPKLRINLRWPKIVVVYDKRHPVLIRGAKFKFYEKYLEVQIPLSALKDPKYVLTSASSWLSGLTENATAWRILELK